MTNGEMIQKVFKGCEVCEPIPEEDIIHVIFSDKNDSAIGFDWSWWNAEYKEPNKSEIPTGSTTKNDLVLIHTEGLDEEIRCTMCTNYMKSDRGCDGSCVVDKDMYKAVMDAIEKRIQPTTRNCFGCKYSKDNHNAGTEECHLCMWKNQYTPTTKNDLGVSSELEKNSKELEKDFGELDCINRAELLKAMDTWDKFVYSAQYGLERLDKDDKGFVPYVKYEDMVNCVKNMPSVTPQEPKILALLEKTYADFCKCEGGEGWLKIDGKEYGTDAGYAIEGVDIFMEVFKRRLAELPSVTPIRPKGHWIPVRVDRYSEQYGHFKINEYKCSNCNSEFEYGYHNYCPYCGAKMVEPQESEVDNGNDT